MLENEIELWKVKIKYIGRNINRVLTRFKMKLENIKKTLQCFFGLINIFVFVVFLLIGYEFLASGIYKQDNGLMLHSISEKNEKNQVKMFKFPEAIIIGAQKWGKTF